MLNIGGHFVILTLFLVGVQAQCNPGIYVQKTHAWNKGYVGKLYLDQSWLSDPTADWKLNITFKSEVAEFKVWDADITNPSTRENYVKNVTSVEVMNKCYNPILYSCQYLELPFLVRYPDGVNDVGSENYDIISVSESVTNSMGASSSAIYCMPYTGAPTAAASGATATATT